MNVAGCASCGERQETPCGLLGGASVVLCCCFSSICTFDSLASLIRSIRWMRRGAQPLFTGIFHSRGRALRHPHSAFCQSKAAISHCVGDEAKRSLVRKETRARPAGMGCCGSATRECSGIFQTADVPFLGSPVVIIRHCCAFVGCCTIGGRRANSHRPVAHQSGAPGETSCPSWYDA